MHMTPKLGSHTYDVFLIAATDPSLVSHALEQAELLRSHDYKQSNVMHNFSVRPLYQLFSSMQIASLMEGTFLTSRGEGEVAETGD